MDQKAFKAWMELVDIELKTLCGLTSNCLADFHYADRFEDMVNPYQVAIEVLEYNDFPLEELGL